MAYDIPQSLSPSSVPGWAWMLGGLATGMGATFLANMLRQKSQHNAADMHSLAPRPPHMYANGTTGTMVPPPAMLNQAGSVVDAGGTQATLAAGVGAVADPAASSSTASADAKGDSSEKADGKVAYEDLVAILRQHGEEARETSALFKKCIQQQQEQYQQTFAEMQKALQAQSQHQKKSPPMDLSAATIQSLAMLMGPAQPTDWSECSEGGAVTVAGGGVTGGSATNPLRESYGAINQSLQRLTHESTSKAELAKSLQTLLMILQNLLNNPSKEASRKVNTSSARFSELFGKRSAAAELLKLAGFLYQEPNFTFAADQDMESAQRVRDLLQDAQRNIEQSWSSRPGTGVEAVVDANSPSIPTSSAGETRTLVPGPPGPAVVAATASTQTTDEIAACVPRAIGAAPAQMVAGHTGGASLQPFQAAAAVVDAGGGAEHHEEVGPGGGPGPNASATTAGAEPLEPRRTAARPWSSSVGLKGPAARPPAAMQGMCAAEEERGQGEDATASHAAAVSAAGLSVAATIATPAVAHPAERQEWVPSPAMAHPAESEDVPPSHAQQQSMQQALQQQPAEIAVPSSHHTTAVAHPAEAAEGSAVSEEPQSGG